MPEPGNPQALNRYAYVLNNPLRYTDPSGHVYIGGITPDDPIPSGCLSPCEIVYSPEGLTNAWNAVKATASLAVDFVPVVGDAKGVVEAFTGHDLLTGEDLGNWRWMGLLGVSELRRLRHTDDALALGKQLALPGFEDIIEEVGGDVSRTIRHHIATNKNWIRDPKWSQKFHELFAKGGMSLEDVANIVELPAELHKGPHSQAYHQWVYRRIEEAIAGLDDPAQIRAALEARLRWIAEQLKEHPEWLKNPPAQGGR